MTDPVKGLMQVNKYEFHGLVLTRPNAQTSVWDVSTGGQLCTDDEVLLKAGATPLIESEAEMLEEDGFKVHDSICDENNCIDPRKIAILISQQNKRINDNTRAINALKGVK